MCHSYWPSSLQSLETGFHWHVFAEKSTAKNIVSWRICGGGIEALSTVDLGILGESFRSSALSCLATTDDRRGAALWMVLREYSLCFFAIHTTTGDRATEANSTVFLAYKQL